MVNKQKKPGFFLSPKRNFALPDKLINYFESSFLASFVYQAEKNGLRKDF